MKEVKDPMETIFQKSISFPIRVKFFMAKHPQFQIHKFCQDAVDEQIAEIDPQFLKEGDPRKNEETA